MTFLQALLTVLVFRGPFFALLEEGLSLLGVRPPLELENPFVGFASNVPLFCLVLNKEVQRM